MTGIVKMYNRINRLRKLIRSEGTPAIQEVWDEVEQFIDKFFKQG